MATPLIAPTVRIDTRELTAAVEKYGMEFSSKDMPFVINRKALFVARKAAELTPRASYEKMAAELGMTLKKSTRKSREGRPTMNG